MRKTKKNLGLLDYSRYHRKLVFRIHAFGKISSLFFFVYSGSDKEKGDTYKKTSFVDLFIKKIGQIGFAFNFTKKKERKKNLLKDGLGLQAKAH